MTNDWSLKGNQNRRHQVHLVGGGLGALAAGIRLLSRGYPVKLVEKNSALGGKCHRFEKEGFSFDTGPSVLTMPFILENLFQEAGKRLSDYLTLEKVEPACRYFFPDGTQFDAPGNLEDFLAAVGTTFPKERKSAESFFQYTRRLWDVSEKFFLSRPLDWGALRSIRWGDIPGGLVMMKPGSLDRVVRSYFKDPRLIQLFNRFATYNGSDPYRTPAAFNVISFVEFGFGSWRCKGGMYALILALQKLFQELGGEVETESSVSKILFDGRNRVCGLVVNEKSILTERVVLNVDAMTAWTGTLLEDHPDSAIMKAKMGKIEASSGGFVLCLALRKTFPTLAHHNIFFTADYPQEFRQLFKERIPLTDPTVYISVQGKYPDENLTPSGQEGWFVLVNSPARPEKELWSHYGDFLKNRLFQLPLGLGEADIRWSKTMSPYDFAEKFGAWKGSLYGGSSNRLFSAFHRIPNRNRIRGLVFAGGSAHPGGGIPLVIRSGLIAAEVLDQQTLVE